MCTQTSKTFIEILQDENKEIQKKLNSNLNACSLNTQKVCNKARNDDFKKQIYTKNVKTYRPGKNLLLKL